MNHKKSCKSRQVVERVHTGDTNDYDVCGKCDCQKKPKLKKRPLTEVSVRDVSDAFTKVIQEWLSPAELKQVCKLNRSPDYHPCCCATHDFCDSNMAMFEAFKRLTGSNPPVTCERHTDMTELADLLWNYAWNMSKEKGFKL